MPKVTAEHVEARRNAILDGALSCFTRRGFHRATMQDICQECGLSPGAIYRYFRSKEQIIEGVMERDAEHRDAVVAAMRATAPDILRALEAVGRYYFARFLDPDFESRARLESELWAESLRNEDAKAASRSTIAHTRRTMAELFSEALREPSTPAKDVDPQALANLVIALYQGLQMCKAIDPEGVDTHEVFRTLYRLATGRYPEEAASLPQAASTSPREGGDG